MRSALLLSCKNVDDATELSRPLSGATKTNVRPLDRWTRKSSEPVVAGCCRLRSSLLFIGVASDARPLLCSLALSSVESHPTTKHFVRSCKGSETISYFLPPNFTFAFRSFVRVRSILPATCTIDLSSFSPIGGQAPSAKSTETKWKFEFEAFVALACGPQTAQCCNLSVALTHRDSNKRTTDSAHFALCACSLHLFDERTNVAIISTKSGRKRTARSIIQ